MADKWGNSGEANYPKLGAYAEKLEVAAENPTVLNRLTYLENRVSILTDEMNTKLEYLVKRVRTLESIIGIDEIATLAANR